MWTLKIRKIRKYGEMKELIEIIFYVENYIFLEFRDIGMLILNLEMKIEEIMILMMINYYIIILLIVKIMFKLEIFDSFYFSLC